MTTFMPEHGRKFAVGITGGIGSGKTSIARCFASLGASVVDTDLIAHQLTAPGGIAIPTIRSEFGEQFIDSAGAMDRAKMREYVFQDVREKKRLEAILHPLIRSQCKEAAARAPGPYVIFVVPLLIESGTWRQMVDRVLVVDCPEELQIARVAQRNQLDRAQILAIMANQASRQERLQSADDVLVNDETIDALKPEISRLHASYLLMARRESGKSP